MAKTKTTPKPKSNKSITIGKEFIRIPTPFHITRAVAKGTNRPLTGYNLQPTEKKRYDPEELFQFAQKFSVCSMRPALLRCPILSRSVAPLWALLTDDQRDEWQALANELQTYEVSHTPLPLDDSLLWLHLNMLWLRRLTANKSDNNDDISSGEDDNEDDESSDQGSPDSSASNPDAPQDHSTPPFLFDKVTSVESYPINPTQTTSILHEPPLPPISAETSHQPTGTVKTTPVAVGHSIEYRAMAQNLASSSSKQSMSTYNSEAEMPITKPRSSSFHEILKEYDTQYDTHSKLGPDAPQSQVAPLSGFTINNSLPPTNVAPDISTSSIQIRPFEPYLPRADYTANSFGFFPSMHMPRMGPIPSSGGNQPTSMFNQIQPGWDLLNGYPMMYGWRS